MKFVPIRNFISPQTGIIDQAALSKAVLFELPKQVTDWMGKHQIAPLHPDTNSLNCNMGAGNSFQAPPPYPMMPR